MAKKNLSEAAAEILKSSISKAQKDKPEVIKDPNEDDTGAPIVDPNDPGKTYDKNVTKDKSAPTKSADEGDVNKSVKIKEDNLDEKKDCKEEDDSDDSDKSDKKDDISVDGEKKSIKKSDLKKEDVDVSEDVESILKGHDLSEEFKTKISSIFEMAVNKKVDAYVDQILVVANNIVAEETDRIETELSESIEDFMKLVAQDWLNENRVAIHNNLRNEITEDFISGLKKLFTESYIDVPEDKVDVLEELNDKVEALEESLNKEINEKVEIYKYIKELEGINAFREIVSEHNLTLSQVEKIKELSENIKFDSFDRYKSKIDYLIENHIVGEKASEVKSVIKEDDHILSEEKTVDSNVKAMAAALSRQRR
jgi:hypothetical protein